MGGYATNPDNNASSEITGSGTANYMAKFTAAQVIGNSNITDNGTTITFLTATQFNDTMYIGTEGVLTWSSSTSFNIYATVSALHLVTQASKDIVLINYNTETMRLFSDNNVSIGYGVSASARLQVAGSTNDSTAYSFKAFDLGMTQLMGVRNDGLVNIGNASVPGGSLSRLRVGMGTSYLDFGESASGVAAIWALQATPTAGNWIMQCDGSNVFFNTPVAVGQWSVGFGNATNLVIATNGAISFTPSVKTSGAVTNFTFTGSSNTGQTASTEINRLLFTSGSRQWATGAITTQREVYITSPTYSFVGASTITNAYSLYVAKPTASTNATITKNIGIGTDGMVEGQGFRTTSYRQDIITSQNGTGLLENQFVANGGVSLASMSSSSAVGFKVGGTGGTEVFRASGINSSGAINNFIFSATSNIGQTASTEINGFLYNSYTRTWAAGAITTQREQYIKTVTYAFASASTITNAYGMYVEAPTAGTNATITNNWAAGFQGDVLMTTASGNVVHKVTTTDTAGGAFNYVTSNSQTLYFVSWGSTATLTTFGLNRASNSFIYTDGGNNLSIGTTSPGTVFNIATGNAIRLAVGTATTSGATSAFTYSPSSNTGQTASTEINGFLYNSYTRTWAAGAITTQREQYIKTVTYAFASASTITNAYGMYVEAPTAGTNATITNNYALGVSGGAAFIDGTTLRIGQASSQIGLSFNGTLSLSDFAIWGSGSTTVLNGGGTVSFRINNAAQLVMTSSTLTLSDAVNFVFNATTGTKIGTATTQKLSFWNATPIVQPTTAVSAASFTANAGTAVNDASTFDGYTLGQITKALRNTGILA